jgi:hypothetical protein
MTTWHGVAVGWLLLASGMAEAGPACTPVASLPYEITAAGRYCLVADLSYPDISGAAIRVSTDDVTLDLGPFTLRGTAGAGTFAWGVFAENRRGITIENGIVRGFLYGVLLADDQAHDWELGGGHLVRNVRFLGNYFRGVRAEGRGVTVEGNTIADTGGTTIYGPGNYAFGIEMYGAGGQALRNVIDRTFAGVGGEAVGISISNSGAGTIVEGNTISNDALSTHYGSFGVWVGGGSRVPLLNNRFVRMRFGAAFHPSTFGVYRDNACTGCQETVRECDAGPCTGTADNPGVIDGGNNSPP